jgi:5'-3' exonuclease
VPPELLAQFPVLEEVLTALGLTVWAMVEHEADDALASAARFAAADERVDQVVICTPDKDLGQCVGGKVVQLDRRKDHVTDAAGVVAKFGVPPESVPDWLALVGDSADGFPGLKGWGATSAAAVLRAFPRVEDIPDDPSEWRGVAVRGAATLAATLREQRARALLFKDLATLRAEIDVGAVDAWEWRGPADGAGEVVERIDAPELATRASALAARRFGGARS